MFDGPSVFIVYSGTVASVVRNMSDNETALILNDNRVWIEVIVQRTVG
jgi:hypothetical protein